MPPCVRFMAGVFRPTECPAAHPYRMDRAHSRGRVVAPRFLLTDPRLPSRPVRLLVLPLRLLPLPLALVALTVCSRTEARPASAAGAAAAPQAAAPATARTSAAPTPGDSTSLLARADRGRIQGDPSAKTWLVIISDFQCPYCRQWHDEVFATVVRDYVARGKIRLAYVNLPLSIHMNAMPAAEAAMCASVQGKFWQMHDVLFRTQDRWETLPQPAHLFDSLAVSVGVEPTAYRSCIQSGATRPMINADQQRAEDAQVRATPTFFIGDQRMEGAIPLADFRAALDSVIAHR